MSTHPIFNQAIEIAQSYDVSTPKNGLVLYSISYLPTTQNRDKAFEFVQKQKGYQTIENTPCGAKLVELNFSHSQYNLTSKEISQIWSIASKRMIEQAQGNIIAFVDGVDYRSVFYQTELPNILKNPHINTINNEDKYLFAKKLQPAK